MSLKRSSTSTTTCVSVLFLGKAKKDACLQLEQIGCDFAQFLFFISRSASIGIQFKIYSVLIPRILYYFALMYHLAFLFSTIHIHSELCVLFCAL